jgi:uncharacterized protein YyaL (SSP411 family)
MRRSERDEAGAAPLPGDRRRTEIAAPPRGGGQSEPAWGAPATGLAIALVLAACGAPHRVRDAREVAIAAVTAESFARARSEDRPIVLAIRAGWCHWCHVMEETTYRDPAVVALLEERFLVIGAEADARPDLAERYADYGWPATVLFTPDGREIVALRGYREPRVLEAILRAIARDQDAGRELGASLDRRSLAASREAPASDLESVRAATTAQLDAMYDEREEGWGTPQKYPFAAPVEHALFRARVRGELEMGERAMRTLEQHARLIDPVWGGMFQYSEGGVWDRPHFEKIVPVQAGAIETFAAAYATTGDVRWLDRARAIARYLRERLRAEDGAFWTSQDADAPGMSGAEFYALGDAERSAREAPRVDRHVYAGTNGEVIAALARLSEVAPSEGALELAVGAARRIEATHAGADGLYRHAAEDEPSVRHLADQAQLLRAFVALHQASGEMEWLERAASLAAAMQALRAPDGGWLAHTEDPTLAGTALADRRRPIAENAIAARALLAMARLLDRDELREEATAALRAVAVLPNLRALGRKVGEYLMALELLSSGHAIAHVVGPRDDPRTLALWRAALAWPDPRRLVELRAPGEGRYPYPGEPSVFLCGEDSCSLPITDPSTLAAAADAFVRGG